MGLTERLARAASRRPWRTIGAWTVLLVLSFGAIGLLLGNRLTNERGASGNPQFRKANAAEAKAFPPDPSRATSDIVIVKSDRYTVDSPEFRTFVIRVTKKVDSVKGVDNVVTFFKTRDSALVSPDRHAMAIPIDIVDDKDASAVIDAIRNLDSDPNFAVEITGDRTINHDFQDLSQHDLKSGELQFGLPAALIVLMLVFGSVVAGLFPVLMAIAAIIVGLGLVAVVAQAWELSVFVINMLTGMGLALGIDYSLFVISRYREERNAGREKEDAIGVAGATASRAVLFSGTAFVVAMFGMLLVPNTVMRSLAAGAILVGAVSVLSAMTLLPALIGLLGDRINSLRVPVIGRASIGRADPESRFWSAIVGWVLRRPAVSLAVSVAALVALAVPVFGLNIGASGVTTLPNRFASVQGFEELQRDFPRLRIYPVRVVVANDASTPAVADAIGRLRALIARDKRFTSTTTNYSKDQDAAVVAATLRSDPASPEAVAAVRNLRKHVIPNLFGGRNSRVYVGGNTSEQIDYLDSVTKPAPFVFAFVLGLTFILLTIVFRSIVIAATAVVLNLLSVGAAYGLLVLVFQHGYAAGLLGFEHSPTIEAWVPLFLFSVLFGLSMDYQVFLLSRIRERYDESGDTADAVQHGVASTARIITGAALIIVAVFLGFAMGDLIQFQQMGFGVAVALLIDATIIRSLVLPSAMKLLGRSNWYLPRWLDWLPDLQVEREAPPRPGLQEP
ncbi:MAG: MMPL family transporter [Actinomycetota bacterium]|nr:MMPL family transporter [Actinomycetota bacterium]